MGEIAVIEAEVVQEVIQPTTAIFVHSQLQKFHQGLLAEARAVLETRRTESEELQRGLVAAEEADEPEQARRYRNRITRRHRDVIRAENVVVALEGGFIPMPKLPAVGLKYTLGTIPPDVLTNLAEAKKTGLFDEFRVVDGRNAWKSGHPRSWSPPPKGRDPILVGMIGDTMFPLGWWK